MSEPEVAIMPAACLRVDLESMQQQTHDALITMVGSNRISGVQWRTVRGAKGLAALEALYADDDRSFIDSGLDQFRAFFAEHGEEAVLIVASCEVKS